MHETRAAKPPAAAAKDVVVNTREVKLGSALKTEPH